jgi:hypothetical protein
VILFLESKNGGESFLVSPAQEKNYMRIRMMRILRMNGGFIGINIAV